MRNRRDRLFLLALAGLAVVLLVGCPKPPPPPPPSAPPGVQTPPPVAAPDKPAQPAGQQQPAPTDQKEKKVEKQAEGSTVKITTAKGTILLELFDDKTPITAGSFLLLVKSKFYDGVKFHRVVPNFVIQGGDPEGTGAGGPGFTIPDEVRPDLKHDKGMLSMAKTAMPDSGGSQFFIVTGGPETVSHLNMKHTVFGKVLEGMDVVDKIVAGDKMESVVVVKESPNAAAAEEAAKKARVKK